ncbi:MULTISPECIES: asparagine synthase-related protein [Listeria]|uniref:asparagine synthase-related protein n=1 Tax=Listeria TaxID=1637 RepID=UPI000B591827|nr:MULTISPECIES: asparagine synthase-related protein [Listeria]
MPGFFGFISNKETALEKDIEIYDIIEANDNLIEEKNTVNTPNLYGRFFRNTVKKFEQDKTFSQNEEAFFIVDGVILNKLDLMEKYEIKDRNMFSLTQKMAQSASKPFFNEFRGHFSGVFLDKTSHTFNLYTNHIGNKEVFYYLDKQTDILYFGTDIDILVKLVHKHAGKRFKLKKNAAYSMITHSYTLCNDTLFEDMYRLTPGHYLQYSANGIEKKCYFEIDNTPIDITEEEAMAKIDELFRNSVKRSFEKDKEYGYKHIAALSGGLDSRMTTWVAHDMGYTDTLSYTFSQTDYMDETVPKKMASELKNEWLFKSLDNGIYLYKYFEEAVKISGGRCQSCSITPTLSMANTLNMDQFGIVHTGHLGGAILGTYYEKGRKQEFHPGSGANSTRLIEKVQYTEENSFHLKDKEIFKLYNRGFTGNLMGLKPFLKTTEAISPYTDVEFMSFTLTLPFKYRTGHNIYIKWINKYYPEAANFVYDKVKGKINRKLIRVKGVSIPWTSIPAAFVKLVKIKLGLKLNSKNHMNPIDYWAKINPDLSNFYQESFNKNIDLIKDEELKKDCQFAFESGNSMEKDQIISFMEFLRIMKGYME